MATCRRPRASSSVAPLWVRVGSHSAKRPSARLGGGQVARLEVGLDEDRRRHRAIQLRRGQVGGVEHGARVAGGALQVAATQQQPGPPGQARGEQGDVARAARLGDAGVEAVLGLVERVGPHERDGRLHEPRQVGRRGDRALAGGEGAAREGDADLGRLVALDGAQGGHAERLARRVGVVGAPAHRVQAAGQRGRRARVEHAGAEGERLEVLGDPRFAVAQLGGRAIDDRDRLRRALGATERVGEQQRGPDADAVVLPGARERLLQVRLADRLAGRGLGDPELEQQAGAVRGRRRLGQDAAQEHGRRLGRAAARGRARRLDEALRDPRIAGGVGGHEVLGDALLVVRVAVEQLGGASVGQRALGAGQLVVDAGAHERVHEGQRAPGLEDPGRDERVERLARLGGVEVGQRRRGGELGALEHGRRAGEPDGGRGEAPHAQQDPAASPARAGGLDVGRGRASGATPSTRSASTSSRTRNGEPPVARWQASTKAASGRAGGPDSTSHATALRLSGARAHDVGLGVGGSTASAVRAVAFDLRARGDDERDRQLLQPRRRKARKRSEEVSAQCASSTTRKQRPLRGEVRAQPVQPVQDGERRVERRTGSPSRIAPGSPSTRAATPGRPLEQLGALGGAAFAQRGLEELAHDAEGEVALELGPARAQDARRAVVGGGPRGGQHRRLADPGGSLDDHRRAPALARARDRRLDARKLAIALEQVGGRGRREYQRGRQREAIVFRPYTAGGTGRLTSPVRAAGGTLVRSAAPRGFAAKI